VKSKVEIDLEELAYIPKDSGRSNFFALEWWKVNNGKFHLLFRIAVYILTILIFTITSKSIISTGKRVINSFRGLLSPNTIQVLICEEDWLQVSHGIKKKPKVFYYFVFYH
jgi:hypothetical protein